MVNFTFTFTYVK